MNKVLVGFLLFSNCLVFAADRFVKDSPEYRVARLDGYFQAHRGVSGQTLTVSPRSSSAFAAKAISPDHKDYASQSLVPSFASASNAESSSRASSSPPLAELGGTAVPPQPRGLGPTESQRDERPEAGAPASSILPFILIPAFFALAGGIALGVNVSILAGVLGGLAIGIGVFGFAVLVNLFSQPSDSPC